MNKRMWSRILAVALAVVMAFSTPAQTVRAAGPDSGAAVLTAAESADVQSPEAEEEVPPDEVFAEEGSAESVVTAEIPAESDAAAGEEDELVVTAETPAEPDAAVDEEAEAGILGAMPDDFVLSAEEEQIKRDLIAEEVPAQLADLTPGEDYVDGEVLCLANSRAEAEAIAEAYHGILSEYAYGVAVISLAGSGLTVAEAVAAGADPDLNVPAVEPDYINTVPEEEPALQVIAGDAPSRDGVGETVWTRGSWWSEAPEDPFLNPANSGSYQWFHEMIDTYPAWQVTKGEGITVAVIDAGVQGSHEEFDDRVTEAALWDEKSKLNEDYGDDAFYYTPRDDNKIDGGGTISTSNGTHVAGIIAAARNTAGGAGIAPEARILSVPVPHNLDRKFSSRHLIQAVMYVAGYDQNSSSDVDYEEDTGERRADILTIPLYEREYSASLNTAIERAYHRGITICAPMGDDQANDRVYPAALDHVIAVAGVNAAGDKTAASSSGAWADIAAPAENIWSTVSTHLYPEGYQNKSGTSQAAAMVAGACALYMSAMGNVHPDVMERVLKETATKTTVKDIGAGILNVGRLMDAEVPTVNIMIYDNSLSDSYAAAAGGETVTATRGVPGDGRLVLTVAGITGGYANADEKDDQTIYQQDDTLCDILYTTDGRAPAIKDGVVTVGEVYHDDISLGAFVSGPPSRWKKSYTIKAACVSATGILGRVTTLTFSPMPASSGMRASGVHIVPDRSEITIVAGSSFTFTGSAEYPDGTTSGKVIWRISRIWSGDLSKATISTTGVLKTAPDQTGVLTVSCTTEDDGAAASIDVHVRKLAPVKEIKLDQTTLAAAKTLHASHDEAGDPNPHTALVSIGTITDTAGNSMILAAGTEDPLDPEDEASDHSVPYLHAGLIAWSSSNNAVATVSAEQVDTGYGDNGLHALIHAVGKGTATITAQAHDGSGKKATFSVTVVQDVEEIRVTGPGYLSIGGRATYKAEVLPADANVKSVSWEIYRNTNRVTDKEVVSVTPAGLVTVGKNADASDSTPYRVRAIAMDGSGCQVDAKLYVPKAAMLTDLVITSDDTDHIYNYQTEERKLAGKDTSVTRLKSAQIMNSAEPVLYVKTIRTEENGKEKISIATADATQYHPVWSVGNTKLLQLVDAVAEGESGFGYKKKIVPVPGAKGTTTITCALNDGGSRKATLSVTVLQGVTNVSITDGPEYLLPGGKGTFKTTVLPATANNKALTWQAFHNGMPNDGVTIDAAGRITVKPDADPGKYECYVTPVAGSDSHVTAHRDLIVLPKTSEILIDPGISGAGDQKTYNAGIKKLTLGGEEYDYLDPCTLTLYSDENYYNTRSLTAIPLSGGRETGTVLSSEFFALDHQKTVDPKWTTGNAGLVTVEDHGSWARISAVPGTRGSTTVTCAAQDGSGVKTTLKVDVVYPVTSISFTGPDYLAPGDRATYKATLPAAAGSRKLTWSLRDADGNPIGDNAAVSINKNTGQVTVNANATQASLEAVMATGGPIIHAEVDGNGSWPWEPEIYVKSITLLPNRISSVVIEPEEVYADLDEYRGTPYRPTITRRTLNKNASETVTPLSDVWLWRKVSWDNLDILGQCLETDSSGKESRMAADARLMTWSSSNEGLVTVTPKTPGGTAKLRLGPDAASGKTGTVTITGKANDNTGKKATLTVRVGKPVESIVIDNAPQYLPVGATFTPKTRVLPADATDKGIEWRVISEEEGNIEIKDPDVVSVTPTGQVKVGNKAVIGRRYRLDAYAKDMNECKGWYYFTATKDKISSILVAVPADKVETVKNKNDGKITERKLKGTSTSLSVLTSCTVLNTAEDKDPSRMVVLAYGLATDTKKEWLLEEELICSSGNESIATVALDEEAGGYVIKGVPGARGTTTISFTAKDGTGKKASLTVKVTQPVTTASLDGPDYIARGYTGTYKAIVGPANADNKKVEWYDVTDLESVLAEGITLSKTGVVTVDKDAAPGTYIVRAYTTDGSNFYPTHSFEVLPGRAKTLGITYDFDSTAVDGQFEFYDMKHRFVTDNTGSLSSLQLFPWDLKAEEGDDGVEEQLVRLKPMIRDDKGNPMDLPVVWSVSDENLLTHSVDAEGNLCLEHNAGIGTATVTCTLLDGTGKKATVKVSVVRPVSGLQLVPAAGSPDQNGPLAFGKTATLKAVVGELYGKAGNTKVEWGFRLEQGTGMETETIDSAFNVTFPTAVWSTNPAAKSYATITNGKLTIPANSKIDLTKDPRITVYARAMDGSGCVATYSCQIKAATTELVCREEGETTTMTEVSPGTRKEIRVVRFYKENGKDKEDTDAPESLTVSSSDPNVVSACYTRGTAGPRLYLIPGTKAGKATVTLTAADGSGVKTTLQVTNR